MDFTDILKRRFFKAKFKNKGLFVGKDLRKCNGSIRTQSFVVTLRDLYLLLTSHNIFLENAEDN